MNFYEKYISKEAVEEIHACTLRILSEVGVRFESEKALEVFRRNGVKVDGCMVYIDRDTVEKALKTVPSSFELLSDFDKKIPMGNHAMNTRIIGHPAFILKDGAIRPMAAEDAIAQFKMSETSPIANCVGVNYAFLNGISVTKEQRVFGPMAFGLKYSGKDKIFLDINVTGCSSDEAYTYTKNGIQLAKNFYGVKDASMMITVINALSPLCYDDTPIHKMTAYMEEDQACIIACCGMPMMTSPPSLAGMLAQTNADVLAGIVFAQLYKPGAKVVYGNTSGSTDMRTIQLGIGSAEAALVGYATAALADFYNIPFRALGGLSDAKQLDYQAGAESMLMLQATYETKPDIVIHHIGCVGSFNVVSLEKIIADEEVAGMVQRKLKGVDVTEKKLCFDTIQSVGPRGTFLQGRTPKMYREEFYLSKLFNKDDANNWQNQGAVPLYECAKQQVKDRLASYCAPERTKEQDAMLNEYLPDIYKAQI